MQISLNGEARALAEGSTVGSLVEALRLDMRKVAVEVNLAIVPRTQYPDHALADGDRIEIVQFIGGG